ncbi:MAG TPA: YkgJ family cysteine cluster protein [Anaerolineae bacterium]|nr:YkgJ family cysteine cluster protein [Anaerolineae bacterium]
MLEAWDYRDEYWAWLRDEQNSRSRAVDQGKEECVRCGYCCCCRTCVPRSDEMQTVADYMGLTVEQLIRKHMVGDKIDGHRFLRFANTKQQDVLGEFLDWRRTYDQGICTLFDEDSKACLIYPVRPDDAKEAYCWDGDSNDAELYKSIHAWKDGDLEKLCPWMAAEDD